MKTILEKKYFRKKKKKKKKKKTPPPLLPFRSCKLMASSSWNFAPLPSLTPCSSSKSSGASLGGKRQRGSSRAPVERLGVLFNEKKTVGFYVEKTWMYDFLQAKISKNLQHMYESMNYVYLCSR